jgi:hypothetical protein
MAIGLPFKNVRLQDMRPPELDIQRDLPAFDVPEGVAKGIADIAAAVHLPGRRRRSRLPLAIGGAIMAAVAWWAITNTQVRARVAGAFEAIKAGIGARWPGQPDELDADETDPIAFQAAQTAPIRPGPHGERSIDDGTPDYPDGLGAQRRAEIPAFDEAGTTT